MSKVDNEKSTLIASRKDTQVNVRLPETLRDRVADMAKASGRSSNTEFVLAIQAYVGGTPARVDSEAEIAALKHDNRRLESELASARMKVEQLDGVLRARAGALRFYEHSVRVNAKAVLASGVELPPALKSLIDEWSNFQGIVP